MSKLKEKYKTLIAKYTEDPDRYVLELVITIEELCDYYDYDDKFLDSVLLREKAIKLIEKYYKKDKYMWSNYLVSNLKKLSNAYKKCSDLEESRKLEIKVNFILEDISK